MSIYEYFFGVFLNKDFFLKISRGLKFFANNKDLFVFISRGDCLDF
jgi:hypothetical protein